MPNLLPAPWRAEKNSFGYVVRDANGQALAYIPGRAAEREAVRTGVLTEDEARIVANCIAQLPQLLIKPTSPRASRLTESYSLRFGSLRWVAECHRLLSRAGVRLAAVLNKALGRQVADDP
jgi:hypothetical protein